jgi:hypothetical protein
MLICKQFLGTDRRSLPMATSAKATRLPAGATGEARQINDRLLDAGRRASYRYLDSYDAFVDRVISVQQKLAAQSRNEALKSIASTQADLARQMSTAYTTAARKLIS